MHKSAGNLLGGILMDFIEENWELIKQTIKKEYDLSNISYNTWIAKLSFHSSENDVVTIVIPSEQSHALSYINNKYKSYFQVTISEMIYLLYWKKMSAIMKIPWHRSLITILIMKRLT